jgi:hypothetical protein
VLDMGGNLRSAGLRRRSVVTGLLEEVRHPHADAPVHEWPSDPGTVADRNERSLCRWR